MGKFHAGCNEAIITNSKGCSIAIKTNTTKLEGEFMSNIEIAGFQSNLIEELDDADLMAVVGGSLLSDVGGIATGPGNESRPTSSAIALLGDIAGDAAGYINGPLTGFSEGALQGLNATVTGVTG